MIRVSGLHEQLEAAVTERSADGLSAQEQLRLICEIVAARPGVADARRCTDDLLPKLAEDGVRVLAWDEIEAERPQGAHGVLRERRLPGPDAARVRSRRIRSRSSRTSRSPSPSSSPRRRRRSPSSRASRCRRRSPRFVPVPGAPGEHADFVLLEELIEAHLDRLFPGMKILGASAFRVTRDADFEIREDEAGDLLRRVADNVRAPPLRRGDPARGRAALPGDTSASSSAPSSSSTPRTSTRSAGPLGVADLMSVMKLDRPSLKDAPFLPSSRGIFVRPPSGFEAIRKGDVLLHHPVRQLRPGPALPRGRGGRPGRARHQDDALPRRGRTRPIVAALARAAENGKQVAVLVELQGPVRRGEQHPVGRVARARRRPRRLRRRGPEDPREDRARRPARGRRDAPLRAPRDRQLQPRDGARLHGPRPLHRARRSSATTPRSSSTS